MTGLSVLEFVRKNYSEKCGQQSAQGKPLNRPQHFGGGRLEDEVREILRIPVQQGRHRAAFLIALVLEWKLMRESMPHEQLSRPPAGRKILHVLSGSPLQRCHTHEPHVLPDL